MTTPRFIPSSEELSKLDRDLRFHPSTTERPTALTPEQIATFNREGYLAGIRIFDKEEIAGIRSYFDDLLARMNALDDFRADGFAFDALDEIVTKITGRAFDTFHCILVRWKRLILLVIKLAVKVLVSPIL